MNHPEDSNPEALPHLIPPRKPRLWVWFLWLGLFYSTWMGLVLAGNHWQTLRDHGAIALAMALGSYVAGSTPMGGGTIGFPILVLLFDQPANLGRDFSYAIQSIGMTSASIFILARRIPIAGAVLCGAMLGSLIGTPVGLAWIAPQVPDLQVKLVFAVLWASFGVLHLFKAREFCGYGGFRSSSEKTEFLTGLGVGLLAATTVSAVSGVGIDMLVYAALVLFFRCDLKIAIPTSVIIMAFTSLVGIGWRSATGTVLPGVYENWLAAAPIVALGAPLGVFMVNLIGRRITLVFVSFLCLGQFVWTCREEWARLGPSGVALACLAVAVSVGLLWALYAAGSARLRPPSPTKS